jgi:magnesium-transporting ATPase (P-type)
VEFVQRDSNSIQIKVNGITEKYSILKINEFTSEQQYMSIIVVRFSDSKIFNFLKGADQAMFSKQN